jgi:hypothetical protein
VRDLTAQVTDSRDETALGQPALHPARVGMAVRYHVIDIVHAAVGGLGLQAPDNVLANPGLPTGRRDEEGDLGVAPFGI